jgi:hypothetical protein
MIVRFAPLQRLLWGRRMGRFGLRTLGKVAQQCLALSNHKSKTELERISVAELNRYRNISGTHAVKPS